MPHPSRLTFGVVLAAAGVIGCSGNGAPNPLGAGGTGGGTGGTSGTGGSGGTNPTFMAVEPCTTDWIYVTSGRTIEFGVNDSQTYQPSCLQVPKGASVMFLGEFGLHPLVPSAQRGTTTGNPILSIPTGIAATFTFPDAGFYAYYCNIHGTDDGLSMAGVIWVK